MFTKCSLIDSKIINFICSILFSEDVADEPIDIDLSPSSEPVKKKAVKISANIILSSDLLSAEPKGAASYEWAALIITRVSKDNKKFKLNIPITVLPAMIKGLEIIKEENLHLF